MLEFKNVSLASAILAFTLFICLLLVPDLIFYIFNVEGNEVARLMSRRAAMLFLGLAIISFMGRNAPHSILRQAVCKGMAATMAGLALVGLYEYGRGFSGEGILLAVAAEVAFASAYLGVWKETSVRVRL